ncbi:ABC transporter permease [Halorientalis litorea]|uniref:ABC transporter permease n=1 Tax=Halorientalis litorea TaxID=2931977 RepID=UPI001FF6C088|nr:ABC transporter permease [Halorientalis litorea]
MTGLRDYPAELAERKDLLRFLVLSNLKSDYSDLVLGYLWWLLSPLLLIVSYYFLVAVIFQRGGENYPLFIGIGILAWRYFVVSINQSMGSIANGPSVIYEIDFPKAVLPMANVASNLVYFVLGMGVVFVLLMVAGIMPTPLVAFVPVIMAIQVVLTLGVSIILALVAVYLEDIQNVMRFATRGLFFVSPALYPVTRIPEQFRDLYMLNPFATLFTSYRDVMLYGEMPPLGYLAFTFVVSVLVLVVGFAVFIRYESDIVKKV